MAKKKKGGGEKKGKKEAKKTKGSSKYQKYEVKDGKVIRKGKPCPKCGSGVFLADHKNRSSCGRCGYMEVKKAEKPEKKKE